MELVIKMMIALIPAGFVVIMSQCLGFHFEDNGYDKTSAIIKIAGVALSVVVFILATVFIEIEINEALANHIK